MTQRRARRAFDAPVERPLVLAASDVRAVLAGRKTALVCPVRPEHCPVSVEPNYDNLPIYFDGRRIEHWYRFTQETSCLIECVRPGSRTPPTPAKLRMVASWRNSETRWAIPEVAALCPLGQRRDRLWGRETAYIAPPGAFEPHYCNARDAEGRPRAVAYVATMGAAGHEAARGYGVRKTPSTAMPRWASRLRLEVTDVRMARLRDLAEADVLALGIRSWSKDGSLYKYAPADAEGDGPCWAWADCPRTARAALARLWRETAGAAVGQANPWVWFVAVERAAAEELAA